MAPLAKTIGVEAMLTDIARGVGEAARILPERSRSPIGAVAVKGVTVNLNFELSAAAVAREAGVGPLLGMKSVVFGLGYGERAVEERQLNTGAIALEIVAIPPAEPAPDVPAAPKRPLRPEPSGDELEKLAKLLENLRTALAAADLDPPLRREAERLLASAARALAEGDASAASVALEQIAALLDAARGGG
jgi:hypothetical protein